MLTTFRTEAPTRPRWTALRERHKQAFKEHGVGLDIVLFFVKVSRARWRAFPR